MGGAVLAGRLLCTVAAAAPAPAPAPITVDRAGVLHAVSVLALGEAWAVGDQPADDATVEALIEHYEGHGWSRERAPIPRGASDSTLVGVDAVSAGDVWVVGGYSSGGDTLPLIEHWNGSRWRISSSPQVGGAGLAAIAAASETDVWTVGVAEGRPLVEHGDGRRWRVVDFPSAGSGSARAAGGELTSLNVLAADDVWAAGATLVGRHATTLIGHWDGTAWVVVPSPTPGKQQLAHLTGISAAGPADVWAVGDYAAGTALLPLIEHWDGSAWTEVEAPHLTGHLRRLTAVTARTADDVWAVGLRGGKTVVLHWDGRDWTQAAAPPGDEGSFLTGVDAEAADDAWAVGAQPTADGFRPLRLHWDGTVWR